MRNAIRTYYYHCGCGTFSRMRVKIFVPRAMAVRFAI